MPEKKLAVDCVIPAAGLSSRMGCWKLMLSPDGGESLLFRTVRTALSACQRVILVGGHRFQELKSIMMPSDRLLVLENRAYESGMLSSIQTGLQEVQRDFFITPVDLPGIREEHYRLLFEKYNGARIIRPVFQGKPGHPILCPLLYRDKILKLKGTRLIPELKKWDPLLLYWEDDSPVIDLDNRTDLEQWQNRMVNK